MTAVTVGSGSRQSMKQIKEAARGKRSAENLTPKLKPKKPVKATKELQVSITVGIVEQDRELQVFEKLKQFVDARASIGIVSLERGDSNLQLHAQGALSLQSTSTRAIKTEISTAIDKVQAHKTEAGNRQPGKTQPQRQAEKEEDENRAADAQDMRSVVHELLKAGYVIAVHRPEVNNDSLDQPPKPHRPPLQKAQARDGSATQDTPPKSLEQSSEDSKPYGDYIPLCRTGADLSEEEP
ncbi:hypothetical protein R1sor_015486 [Riccia sorocarpa]|uniref:Uncharacterized protein n=1 Tax=Riccia sorocarpa TaxID=122646 RepID=A0ABD3HCD2_9MARC